MLFSDSRRPETVIVFWQLLLWLMPLWHKAHGYPITDYYTCMYVAVFHYSVLLKGKQNKMMKFLWAGMTLCVLFISLHVY